MKIIDLEQGSALWHQHRRDHWNASDAPAMMGCSPHKTRNDLLRELHTGLMGEVDASTQRRFDEGHRFEALCRPIAESIVGEDLYAIVKVKGKLSASLDGETLMGDVDWEHKQLNDRLRDVMPAGFVADAEIGRALPLDYRIQLEHQQHCSGATRTLFSASQWADDDTLVEARHCWYEADMELRADVLLGWVQFDADLAAYTPPAAAPVVTAAPVEHLPALSVRLDGALAVVSNLEPFGVALRAFVAKIPAKPSTDQEFADTEAACKRLKEAEDRLQQAEDSALASMVDVETMRRMVADFRGIARTARLASEKMVTARKAQIREDECARGRNAVIEHVDSLNRRLGQSYMPQVPHDFPGAIKGLKTIDSLRNAIDTELARFKIAANEVADRIDANLKTLAAAGSPMLFADRASLVLKAPDDLAAVIAQRLAAEQARQDRERERIRAEEAARAEREAAQRQAAIDAELARQHDVQAIHAPTPAVQPEQIDPAMLIQPAPVLSEKSVADANARAWVDSLPDTRPPLKLGDVNALLGLTMTTAFVTDVLRVQPVGTDKRAVLFAAADFGRICEALSAHALRVKAPA